MFGKKYPVLTATNCSTMEIIRTAVEVLFGERVSYVHADFNTRNIRIRIGDEEHDIRFIQDHEYLIDLLINGEWYTVLFEKPKLVKVSVRDSSKMPVRKTYAGEMKMRWVGWSFVARWEEPLFLREAEHCAEVRGLTLEQLLETKL